MVPYQQWHSTTTGQHGQLFLTHQSINQSNQAAEMAAG
jgi:hypothetical protein